VTAGNGTGSGEGDGLGDVEPEEEEPEEDEELDESEPADVSDPPPLPDVPESLPEPEADAPPEPDEEPESAANATGPAAVGVSAEGLTGSLSQPTRGNAQRAHTTPTARNLAILTSTAFVRQFDHAAENSNRSASRRISMRICFKSLSTSRFDPSIAKLVWQRASRFYSGSKSTCSDRP
jgi:hypothetical protein